MAEQNIDYFAGNKVAVFGLARTGRSVIKALLAGNAKILAIEDNLDTIASITSQFKSAIADQQLQLYRSQEIKTNILDGVVALIPSPGIKRMHPIIQQAMQANIPIMGDIDLLYLANPKARFIGITGTNGKSTTTALIAHCLNENGIEAVAGGNLGVAALSLPVLRDGGVYVLEISSYQLESLSSITLEAAILLNITPDHLDYHGSMTAYAQAKAHIFDLVRAGGLALIGTEEAESDTIYNALCSDRTDIQVNRLETITLPQALTQLTHLPGEHNQQNIRACYQLLTHFGVESPQIISAISTFKGLAHRLELVGTYQSMRCFNDSKATNPQSTAKALACFSSSILWIAGGQSKHSGYAELTPYIGRVKAAYLLGEAAAEIAAYLTQWQASHPDHPKMVIYQFKTLAEAVHKAFEDAQTDQNQKELVLLFSPACASFDQYDNFEQRGIAFKQQLKSIKDMTFEGEK